MPSSAPVRHDQLKVGILVPHLEYGMAGATPHWTDIRDMAQCAEALDFDSLWLHDHLIFPPLVGSDQPLGTWECWSLLAALAATTTRVEIGTTVVCTNFRNPALLAKMADTVDEISGGRLILGLGAGYSELEFGAFGYPSDHLVSRFAEAITIVHGLLRNGHIDFAGSYYQAHDCMLRPRGPRNQGPPILIGSMTGPRMLQLTAQYADLWNSWTWMHRNSPAGFVPLSAAVDAACMEVGRDPQTLARTAAVLVELPGATPYPAGYHLWFAGKGGKVISGTPVQIAEVFRGFADAGVSHLQVWLNPGTEHGLQTLAESVSALRRNAE